MSNAASMALSGLVGIAFGCVLLWFVVYPLLGARPKWWRRATPARGKGRRKK